MLIVHDDEFISSPFTFDVSKEMAIVSDFFRSEFNIIFNIETRTWGDGIGPDVTDFIKDGIPQLGHGQEVIDIIRSLRVQAEAGDDHPGICIGLTGKLVHKGFGVDKRKVAIAYYDNEYSGIRYVLMGVCEVQEVSPASLISHEICHLFEARDIYDDTESIMNNFPHLNRFRVDDATRGAVTEFIELNQANS